MAGWAAAISAGSKIFGGWLSGKSSAKAAKAAHKRNVSAYKQRYQWTMQDMQKAGLNPILAASQGPGSVAGSPIAEAGQLGEGLANAPASALAAMQTKATISATQAQAAKTGEDAKAAATDNIYREREVRARTEQSEYDREIKSFEYGSAHSAATAAAKEKGKDGRILTLGDRAKLAEGSAKLQSVTESEARTALIQAGLPVAQFEGAGGKYLIQAVQLLMSKGLTKPANLHLPPRK